MAVVSYPIRDITGVTHSVVSVTNVKETGVQTEIERSNKNEHTLSLISRLNIFHNELAAN